MRQWKGNMDLFLEMTNKHGVQMLMVGGGAVNFHGHQKHSADNVVPKNRPRFKSRPIPLVPWGGIEPPLPKELDFESSASTSSATKALVPHF